MGSNHTVTRVVGLIVIASLPTDCQLIYQKNTSKEVKVAVLAKQVPLPLGCLIRGPMTALSKQCPKDVNIHPPKKLNNQIHTNQNLKGRSQKLHVQCCINGNVEVNKNRRGFFLC